MHRSRLAKSATDAPSQLGRPKQRPLNAGQRYDTGNSRAKIGQRTFKFLCKNVPMPQMLRVPPDPQGIDAGHDFIGFSTHAISAATFGQGDASPDQSSPNATSAKLASSASRRGLSEPLSAHLVDTS